MQAIRTKYLAPTNTKGARIKVQAQAGYIILGWDHSLDAESNHAAAASEYVDRKGWRKPGREWVGGQLEDGSWAWTCTADHSPRA